MTYLFLVAAGIILVAFFAFWFKKRAANQGSKSQPVPAKIVTSGQCAFEKLAENFRTQGCRYKAFKVRFAKRKEGWPIQAQQKNVNMNWQDLEQFFELEAYAKDNVFNDEKDALRWAKTLAEAGKAWFDPVQARRLEELGHTKNPAATAGGGQSGDIKAVSVIHLTEGGWRVVGRFGAIDAPWTELDFNKVGRINWRANDYSNEEEGRAYTDAHMMADDLGAFFSEEDHKREIDLFFGKPMKED